VLDTSAREGRRKWLRINGKCLEPNIGPEPSLGLGLLTFCNCNSRVICLSGCSKKCGAGAMFAEHDVKCIKVDGLVCLTA